MKKVLIIFLVAFMTFSLMAGCDMQDGTDDDMAEDMQEGAEELGEDAGDALTGDGEEEGADEVTGSSMVSDEESLKKAMSEDGSWIVIFTEDMNTEEELVLEGEFIHDGEPARKLALYTQDEDHNKTDSFTLTAPKLTVKSENARIQGGTFKGDVYVEANGFSVIDGKVDGNVYFASQEYQDSFTTSDGGEVTGKTEVQE